jgi:hypothetical protein
MLCRPTSILSATVRNYSESKKTDRHRAKNYDTSVKRGATAVVDWLRVICTRLFLPEGYPESVAPGYLHFFLLHTIAVSPF